MVHVGKKTDLGMLSGPLTLESTPAGNPGVGTKRDVGCVLASGRTLACNMIEGVTAVGAGSQQEVTLALPSSLEGKGYAAEIVRPHLALRRTGVRGRPPREPSCSLPPPGSPCSLCPDEPGSTWLCQWGNCIDG